ncbi:hypothetical protein BDV95DRAFT_620048, partial [Massariosphaeria phaeospora]
HHLSLKCSNICTGLFRSSLCRWRTCGCTCSRQLPHVFSVPLRGPDCSYQCPCRWLHGRGRTQHIVCCGGSLQFTSTSGIGLTGAEPQLHASAGT